MDKKAEASYFYIIAIVAIVAVVGIVILATGKSCVYPATDTVLTSGQAINLDPIIWDKYSRTEGQPGTFNNYYNDEGVLVNKVGVKDTVGQATHEGENQALFSVISREMYQHRVVVSRVSGDESLLHNPLPSYDPFNYGEIGYSDLNNEYHILFDECIWGDTDQGAEPIGMIEYYTPYVFYYKGLWLRDIYYEIVECTNGYDVQYPTPGSYTSSQCRCKTGNAETRETDISTWDWIDFLENRT